MACLMAGSATRRSMARPREFDEATVLEAAMNCFWAQGYELTSVRELAKQMGITGASLYNAFGDERSVTDKQRRGCMLVNSALELAPYDPEFQKLVAQEMIFIEAFFRRCIEAGQKDGTISASRPGAELAKLLLSVLLGIRVLARTRPERAVLEDAANGALELLKANA